MYMLTEKDITARLIDARALFHKIHVIMQRFDVIPSDKNHIGAYIEYTDSNFPHPKAKKNATGQGKETKKVA